MRWPELAYIQWAKALPRARYNLARSGVEPCPASVLRLGSADLVTSLPVRYGYEPLRDAIARRYGVATDQVFTVSGGASLANWVACAAALDAAPRGAEVLVERPTYEPLVRIPEALGHRVRRFDRRWREGYAIDLDRFAAAVGPRTRLAIVTNLHNPSGARIPEPALAEMARLLARVGARLLVDEVYLECLFRQRPRSCVHAAPNVVATNSLTKAYGLDGLRSGWVLGPAPLVRRAAHLHDLLGNNGVAPGEQFAWRAFRRIGALDRRAHALLDPNLRTLRAFLGREARLDAFVPEGGNVVFPRVPRGLDTDRLAEHLRDRYSTLVVPGRLFEAPGHVRLSFGIAPERLARGLRNVSRALDDLAPSAARPTRRPRGAGRDNS